MEKWLLIGSEYTYNGFVLTIIYSLIVVLIGSLIKKGIKKVLSKKIEQSNRDEKTTLTFIMKSSKTIINGLMILAIAMEFKAFSSIGKTLLGASGVLALFFGVAAQESVGNLIGGLFLTLFKPFNVGDLINIPDKNLSGKVVEIGLRHTIIMTFSNTSIVVPNSMMNNTIIENKFTKNEGFMNFLSVVVPFDSDIDEAMTIMQHIAENHPMCLDLRSSEEIRDNKAKVAVVVTGFKEYGVEIRASISTTSASSGFQLCCDVRKSMIDQFKKKGIKIATFMLPTNN